jgi:hypothetical protein
MLNNLKRAALFIGVALMAACSPIDNYEDQLEKVEKKIAKKEYAKSIDSTEKTIRSLSKDSAYVSLLKDEVIEAEKKKADKIVSNIHKQAKSLRAMEDLDDNHTNESKAGKVYGAMQYEISKLRTSLRKWKTDYTRVNSIIAKRTEEKAALEKAFNSFNTSYIATKSKFNKAIKDHPHQKERIETFKAHLDNFDEQYKYLVAFFAKPVDSLKIEDYLDYVGKYNSLKVKSNFPLTLSSDYDRMIDQLYRTYSKVLKAKEESHGVTLGAVSWDNYYDYPTEHNRTFPYTEVSYKQLQDIQSTIGSGRTLYVSSIKSNNTIALATSNKSKTGWTNGDDEAEVWIEDAESEYTHSYLVIEDGKSSEIEETVDRATYLKLADAIGKEVFSKPYGKFEDEAIDKPQVPGMAYVGNANYGQWQADPISGVEIWTWFMAYSIIDDIVDDRIDRRRHERYMTSMRNYVPPKERRGHSWTNSYGVTSNKSPIQKSLTRSRNSNLRGSGESFRNRGPGKGK